MLSVAFEKLVVNPQIRNNNHFHCKQGVPFFQTVIEPASGPEDSAVSEGHNH
jgi:hypothetical protein